MRSAIGSLALLAAAACAPAQVVLSTVQGGVTTPAGAAVSFGSVAAGWGVADVTFNISYAGTTSPYYLTYFSLQQGTPFTVLQTDWQPQLLPVAIPSAGLNFTVRFRPNQVAASDSAELKVGDAANPITVVLFGKANPGFTVTAGNQLLTAGQAIAFGDVQVGSSGAVPLTLANQTSAPITLGAIAFQGSAFQLTGKSPAGAVVPNGSSATLQLTFTPTVTGPQQGTLTIGMGTFTLTGTGLAPPPPVFPNPTVQLTVAAPASALQGTAVVNLAAASASSGSGTLTMAFQSAVSGISDDPAVTFADGTRSAAFTVAEGASAGRFANGPSISFGTGTTAGTLTFAVTLGNNSAQASLTIPGAAIGIDAAVAARNVACAPSLLYCTAANVELQINGWDNTRSTSQIVFTFFDSSGNTIAPGNITVAAATSFQQYFAGSDLGGVFGLHALFPVNGDSNQVVAAQVQLINSAGTAQSAKIAF
jgi:hypothetical protein